MSANSYKVYVLQNHLDKLYVGQTNNIDRRLQQHNQIEPYQGYTKGRGHWRLVYSENYATRGEAMKREKQLKSGQGRRWLREMINGSASA